MSEIAQARAAAHELIDFIDATQALGTPWRMPSALRRQDRRGVELMHANANKVTSRLLVAHYPEPKLALKYSSALELLIAVILSAQCTDARVNDVTRHLFRKYRIAAADPAALEEEVRPTGFYRNKAKAVIGCCRKLVEEFGGKVPDTLKALVSLPGVGRKTANMVLGNASASRASPWIPMCSGFPTASGSPLRAVPKKSRGERSPKIED